MHLTVSFHNFKSQNLKLSVSNPKSKYVAYLSVLSRISNCQGLGRKKQTWHFENWPYTAPKNPAAHHTSSSMSPRSSLGTILCTRDMHIIAVDLRHYDSNNCNSNSNNSSNNNIGAIPIIIIIITISISITVTITCAFDDPAGTTGGFWIPYYAMCRIT